ncbi:RICIN domain-containing protein [Actinosynnema sp. NPDC050436]|uniref:RICIN domain-containing protein n=1 Tax=Actinosynnema sp. NPDC050436 TaxID=3155659 RepID=UPI00340F0FC7
MFRKALWIPIVIAACAVHVGASPATAAPTPGTAVAAIAADLPPADPGFGFGARQVTAQTPPRLYGPYNIRAQNSGKCLDIAGGPGAQRDGDPAVIWDCLGRDQGNQLWFFRTTDEQYVYTLHVWHSNKCLDIAGGTGAHSDGDRAQQWTCLGPAQTNQKWRLYGYSVDDRTIHRLVAVHSGKCLDVAGGVGTVSNGTIVHQWTCLGDHQTNQRWYLTTP